MTRSASPVRSLSQPPRLGPEAAAAPAREFPSWPVTALSVPILLRAAIFTLALAIEPWTANPARIIPAWAQILQSGAFGVVAFVLLHYGRDDRRAWALGLFILDAGATLLTPFVRAIAGPPLAVQLALHLRTDAFQAALLWFFASLFPRSAVEPRLARAFNAGAAVAFALGVMLVIVDGSARLAPGAGPAAWQAVVETFQRSSPARSDWYFTSQFLWLTPLLVLMPLKLREGGPSDRRRFAVLVAGVSAGFLPLAIDVLLLTLWPRYAEMSSRPPFAGLRGGLIVIALTTVPLSSAYAALVQRTLDLRLVVRRALQYVLASWSVRMAAAVPFLVAAALVAFNREQRVIDLLTGTQGAVLIGLTVAGLVAARFRQRLLDGLDHRFFREQVDTKLTLIGVADGVRRCTTIDQLRDTLAAAAESAFHPEIVVTAIVGSDDMLHADADLPPLRRASALAQLLGNKDTALELGGRSRPIVERLAPAEREWLKLSRAQVIVPLRGSGDELLGVLAVGEKQSELPYSTDDQRLLAAVGSSGGLALERILRSASEARAAAAGLFLADPPARECVECGAVHDGDLIACPCGGLLQRSAVPHRLGDRLVFERRIGAGGMGVVYRAMDVRLQQPRAVKALPTTDPARVARVRREARSMAAVSHPNLAILHGLEIWRDAPMLVMELLEGGTLASRLAARPLDVKEAAEVGALLAGALAGLHGAGLLHRDLKPSNIGFTAGGVPKLLDFGLTKLLAKAVPTTDESDDSTWSISVSTVDGGIRGTPAYLSPELLAGAPPSAADDLWGLSVTLLEASTGVNPFKAATVAATVARVLTDRDRAKDVARGLPERGRVLFEELLGPQDRRPANARAMAERLRQELA